MKAGYGKRIKEIREKNDLSRGDFGDKLGLSYDQILKIENESRRPSDEIKVKIKAIINSKIRQYYWIIIQSYQVPYPHHR